MTTPHIARIVSRLALLPLGCSSSGSKDNAKPTGATAEPTAKTDTPPPEQPAEAAPARSCAELVAEAETNFAKLPDGLRSVDVVVPEGRKPTLSRAGQVLDRHAKVLYLTPEIPYLQGESVGSGEGIKMRMKAELNLIKLMAEPGDPPPLVYLAADRRMTVADLASALFWMPEEFQVRFLTQRESPFVISLPETSSRPLVQKVLKAAKFIDPSYRAREMYDLMKEASGTCTAAQTLLKDTGSKPYFERAGFLTKNTAAAMRACECASLDMEAFYYGVVAVIGAHAPAQRWWSIELADFRKPAPAGALSLPVDATMDAVVTAVEARPEAKRNDPIALWVPKVE